MQRLVKIHYEDGHFPGRGILTELFYIASHFRSKGYYHSFLNRETDIMGTLLFFCVSALSEYAIFAICHEKPV
jgi:hypothetical protein